MTASIALALSSLSEGLLADHRAASGASETALLLAIPLLWIAGVVLLIVHKLRSR